MSKHKNSVRGDGGAAGLFCLCGITRYSLWRAIGASAEQQALLGSYFAISQSQELAFGKFQQQNNLKVWKLALKISRSIDLINTKVK